MQRKNIKTYSILTNKGSFSQRAWNTGIEHSLFVLFIFLIRLALAYFLSAERSIEERKNASFHARSANEPKHAAYFTDNDCARCADFQLPEKLGL